MAEALTNVVSERLADGVALPQFKVDAGWPKLPDDIILGQVPGLSVDGEDTVWIIQRPNSLGATEKGLDMDPPITAACCRSAPHIMRFDQSGNLLTAWGGPASAPTVDGVNQWPANVHGIHVDETPSVWLGGNGDGDHVVLNYTLDGKFIRQVGKREETDGNSSDQYLGNPADIFANKDSVLIADGYINKRVTQHDSDDLSFLGTWGAYGEAPDVSVRKGAFDQSQATSTHDGGANPESASFGDIVHCIERGPDDRIYVCDRRNNRIQVFSESDNGINFVRDIVIAPETGGTRTASDIAFSPDGTYMYVADMMNGKVWILLADTYQIIGSFGRNGRYPGQFIWLHSVAVDSQGNVYTTEVNTGRRVQKFVFTGLEKS